MNDERYQEYTDALEQLVSAPELRRAEQDSIANHGQQALDAFGREWHQALVRFDDVHDVRNRAERRVAELRRTVGAAADDRTDAPVFTSVEEIGRALDDADRRARRALSEWEQARRVRASERRFRPPPPAPVPTVAPPPPQPPTPPLPRAPQKSNRVPIVIAVVVGLLIIVLVAALVL